MYGVTEMKLIQHINADNTIAILNGLPMVGAIVTKEQYCYW